MARRRRKMARRKSKRVFTKYASRTHKRNVAAPMRGGIRL